MIMTTHNMAGAFLTYHDEVLMMKRGSHKKIAPNSWAGIGGFIEPHELNDPLTACLREIKEETGIDSKKIKHIELKYITIGKTNDVIEIIYYFHGELNQRCEFIDTDEGMLHWLNIKDMKALPMSQLMRCIADRWSDNVDDGVMVCVVNDSDCIDWKQL